jgi:hypothetical protein
MVLCDPRTKEAWCRRDDIVEARCRWSAAWWKLGAGDQQHYGSSVRIVSRS